MWTRRNGRGRNCPVFTSRISAVRFSSRFASNILMLTLSTPAAPRFRLTAWNACRITLGVILPVSECTLIFLLMASLSRVVTTKFRPASFRGCFLAPVSECCIGDGFLGCPGKSTGRPILGCGQGANYPHGLVGRSSSSIGLTFRPPTADYSGSAATLKEVAVKATFTSPTASPERFHLRLIRSAYRPSDDVGLHRSCLRTIFLRRRHTLPAWSIADLPYRRRWEVSEHPQRFIQGR
jgi:hypothetical protein